MSPCKTLTKRATSKEVLKTWFNNLSKYSGKFKIINIKKLKDKKSKGTYKYKLKYKPKK